MFPEHPRSHRHNLHCHLDCLVHHFWCGRSLLSFGAFKAVTQFRFSGTQHPGAEISCFNTHNQCLVASGVTLLGYILGMLLLGALPSKWDHVAAIYLQGKTAHTAIDYTEVRNAIIAEYDRTGTVGGSQQHAHKISAVKRRGTHDPLFSQQRSGTNTPKAKDNRQGSSNKKKPKKSKGKANRLTLLSMSLRPHPSLLLHLQCAQQLPCNCLGLVLVPRPLRQ